MKTQDEAAKTSQAEQVSSPRPAHPEGFYWSLDPLEQPGPIYICHSGVNVAQTTSLRTAQRLSKMLNAAVALDGLDWCVGYELTEAGHRTPDKALSLAREGLREVISGQR